MAILEPLHQCYQECHKEQSPLLFLIFNNDIAANVNSSIRLFADDCLVYRETQKKEDCELLQKDLDVLVAWSKT